MISIQILHTIPIVQLILCTINFSESIKQTWSILRIKFFFHQSLRQNGGPIHGCPLLLLEKCLTYYKSRKNDWYLLFITSQVKHCIDTSCISIINWIELKSLGTILFMVFEGPSIGSPWCRRAVPCRKHFPRYHNLVAFAKNKDDFSAPHWTLRTFSLCWNQTESDCIHHFPVDLEHGKYDRIPFDLTRIRGDILDF